MTIETKFNIGQEVWFMNNNKEPEKRKIYCVMLTVYDTFNIEMYRLMNGGSYGMEMLHLTKQSLLNSLA